MWETLISYFAKRHLLTNLIFITVFVFGAYFWFHTMKEELPDITFDTMRITVHYSGATADDVEHFVTRPIEEELRGVDGIYRVTSNSSSGVASINVELEPNLDNKSEVITDIKNTVMDVNLPEDILDDPQFRVFKTSQKAIVDIAVYPTDVHLLNTARRQALQQVALALENRLLSRPEISRVEYSGYLQPEIQIELNPNKLRAYNLSFNQVIQEIQNNHLRIPAGSLKDRNESKVTIDAELDTVQKLNQVIVQGSFEGQPVRLRELATIKEGYQETTAIRKINGHEGLFLRVVKSSSTGILDAMAAVHEEVAGFQSGHLGEQKMAVLLLDDESRDVRNRLSLIGWNGLIGFVLVLVMLLIFLDLKSSLWVAMGIPFTFCLTMIFVHFIGYTINNITLAAVIIVMGMIVDDAIVVAENISRFRSQGMTMDEAVVKGTSYVFLPILASIVTTCVAFIPLLDFPGHMGRMVAYIPAIVTMMLGASLFESVFILPAHMKIDVPRWLRVAFSLGTLPLIERYFLRNHRPKGVVQSDVTNDRHWFLAVEAAYGRLLNKVLVHKGIVFLVFLLMFTSAIWLVKSQMRFVMFPNEETTEVFITGFAPDDANRFQTEQLVRTLEAKLDPYVGKEVVGYRTAIAMSRRGSAVKENQFRLLIELVPKEKRTIASAALAKRWEEKMKAVPGINKLMVAKSHFGQASGSPIEVLVQENNDQKRETIARELVAAFKKLPDLTHVEIDEPKPNQEFKLKLDREKIKRLGINPSVIGSSLRAMVDGKVLYELSGDDETIDVRLTAMTKNKQDLRTLLDIPIENNGHYLVPLKDLVTVRKVKTPSSIYREELKRTTSVFADLKDGHRLTPLEIAEQAETTLFPDLIADSPSTRLSFGGEIKDTRESGGAFILAIALVVGLIYLVLALLFNSLVKPLLIMLSIPFGVIGVVFAFWAHGMTEFGFMAAVGLLGLTGVVVNDSIVMLSKLDREYDRGRHQEMSNQQIAEIAQTRLRAVMLTTLTTVVAILPTAYGWAGYDAMLAEMMLALAWGLLFSTMITLLLVPALYSLLSTMRHKWTSKGASS